MKAESRALSTLVGLARGDMRGCLNTLQVLSFPFVKWGVVEVVDCS